MRNGTRRPLLLGHRGTRPARPFGLRLPGTNRPLENTLAALKYALTEGCDGVEFDLRYTRDRRSVLCHDPKLDRKEVAHTDYAGLERRLGDRVPCLEDVLSCFGTSAFLDVELKTAGHEEEVVSALRARSPKRGYVVSSFLPEVLLRLHEIEPSLPLGYVCKNTDEAQLWSTLPISVFIPHYSLVSPGLIDEVHARDAKLFTWTVNDKNTLVRLGGWGVDGLISDDPRLLASTFLAPMAAAAY